VFTQRVEYAVRTAVWLAAEGGEARTTRQIAAATRVPTAYLSKILQTLVRAGIVASQRGLRGGFILTRPADAISLLDVVNAIDPLTRIETCPLGLELHADRLCPVHHRLDDAIAHVERLLRATTLAELTGGARNDQPFCNRGV